MGRNDGSRMKKPCDCCQKYLDHLDEKNQTMSCFLMRMTANTKHSMTIPNRFLKHFAGKLSGTIKLESANGSLYDVEVTERYRKMVLRHGWEAFVDAHHIEENDSLLFRNIENSVFKVLILDSDGCEKMFCCSGIKTTPNVGKRSVDSVDISSSSQYDTTESSGSERAARCVKGSSNRHGKTSKMAVTSSSSGGSGDDIPSENESFESDDLQTPPGADYVISCRSHLSEEQKERVIALIQEIQPEITVYIAVMQKCHVHPPNPFVAITKEYAFAHFPHGNANVTLHRPGKSKKWHPKFYTRKDRSVYMLRGQWLDFVRDNHVQERDICLFLPTNGGRFTFIVYLLRATATHSGRRGAGFQRVGPCLAAPSANMASEIHKEEPTDGEHVSLESDMHEISHESLESGQDSGGPSQPPYILPGKSRLSKSQKKIVEERVRDIQCEVPIYVAIMTKSSLAYMQEFGSRYAAAVHLPAKGQTMVLHCLGKIWKIKMVFQRVRRWFLSGGWPKFVRGNGLRAGDICLFELKKNQKKLTMKVHIISREQL
ncbi:hypothetical protein SEVIR_9G164900v4 [Setaria viridis]|nr:B3 domain-containing protein Os03g0619800-like isoform X3 [Setaria viridis]XP_034572558.1 B3 domain-containing protein Os03g0619800-like isoform X3 [Setaria viridis]